MTDTLILSPAVTPRDFAWITGRIASWLHRTDVADQAEDFLMLAEARIYRELRIRCMETALSSTVAAGVIAVPSGYVEMKHLRVDGNRSSALMRKDSEWIYANYPVRSADGLPKFFAREADNFIFGPYPDSTYTIKGLYYKALDALSDTNTTNWFTANAPDLLLFGALCEAAPYLGKDSRIPIWETKFASVKDAIQLADDNENFSGSPLAMTSR